VQRGGAGDPVAAARLRKEEGHPGGAGLAIGSWAESFWADAMEIKGKRFWAAKRNWAENFRTIFQI
jgi:hypothetical protein